jgi:hypothetical protein
MIILTRNSRAKGALLVCLLLASGPALAYIDPNAGGFLFQLLAPLFAAAVGAWVFLRRWVSETVRNAWNRFMNLFSGK